MNTASWPAGSRDRSAVKSATASPSGSAALTATLTVPPSVALTVAGATTTGARSGVGVPIVNASTIVPGVQLMSSGFVASFPAGPHRNAPSMPVAVKRSRSTPRW